MLNTIVNNPFRLLGVYSNATQKEITANATKQKAFLKVNKTTSFPSDLSWKMGIPQRSAAAIENSQAQINLPDDKITHALFWFVNVSPLDKAALSNLEAGNEDKAQEIWNKKICYSSLLNLAVLALVNDDLDTYIANITTLIHDNNHRNGFVSCICDTTFQIGENNLVHRMIDALLQEVEVSKVYDKFKSNGTSSANDIDYLKGKAVAEPIAAINSKISKTKSVPQDNAAANYIAGVALINATEKSMHRIREIVGEDDPAYQKVADDLAQTILQCGINYYNNTDDDDDVEKALYIQKKALEIAVGTIAQNRCEENVSILEKKKKISRAKGDIDAITEELTAFRGKINNIPNAKALIEKCKPHLLNISSELGSTNDLYLKISSAVANNALGMLISVVNDAQSGTPNLRSLSSTIRSAMSVMDEIGKLAMTSEERKHFTTNKATLADIQDNVSKAITDSLQIPIPTIESKPVAGGSRKDTSSSNSDESKWGCLILFAASILLEIIIALCNS